MLTTFYTLLLVYALRLNHKLLQVYLGYLMFQYTLKYFDMFAYSYLSSTCCIKIMIDWIS